MIQIVHVYTWVCSHNVIELPYQTGHFKKSSLTLFHEFLLGGELNGATGETSDSSWQGRSVVVGLGSKTDGAQLALLYFFTMHLFWMYMFLYQNDYPEPGIY